ncbi:PREDICTED: uncharacterized protein LOC109467395 [Branchiostoma belcheri]|uniref:Uncharacterized protein LOC109467395 n=1 Tax=Branchiostoma belcheri TaxID=7741 RepID=A0A6P4YG02_BRABE|nr:PREDICTED: uncharacterized protein LOC109467395 [Branchiostoma belcheri]
MVYNSRDMNVMIPPDATRPTGGRCVKTLRWIGCLIALVGIMISVAVVIMTGMHSDEGIRFPGEGLLLLFVGVTLVLLSLCYTSYSHGTTRRQGLSRQNSVLSTNMDQPPSYWEVCDLSYDNPVMAPTVITEDGVIIVPTSRLRSISEGVVIDVDSLLEEPDEPLPKYEDVVGR